MFNQQLSSQILIITLNCVIFLNCYEIRSLKTLYFVMLMVIVMSSTAMQITVLEKLSIYFTFKRLCGKCFKKKQPFSISNNHYFILK